MTVTINEVRKYWDDRPCNVRHSQKEIGTTEYFDEVERKRYTAEPHIPAFAGFSNTNGKKGLEVGVIKQDLLSFYFLGLLERPLDYY